MNKQQVKEQLFYLTTEDYRDISFEYSKHFKEYESQEYPKGNGSIFTNQAFKYLNEDVNDAFGNKGQAFSLTFNVPERQKRVLEAEVDGIFDKYLFIFRGIKEDYYNAIINYNVDDFPEENRAELIKQAELNAKVAKETLASIKERMQLLENNQDFYNQYWS